MKVERQEISSDTQILRTRSQIVTRSHEGERNAFQWLRMYLPSATRAKYRDSFDVEYRGRLIEIKAASPSLQSSKPVRRWVFNIHRHGILKEDGICAYVLRLDDVPDFTYAIHLVVPAPVRIMTISINLRSLMTRWGRYFNRIDYIEPEFKVRDWNVSEYD